LVRERHAETKQVKLNQSRSQ